jgi:uncharacterized damage-inducible protein DinB
MAGPNQPEPWLRGPLEGVPLHLMPVFHSFQQVREDLEHHLAGLSSEQIWRPCLGGSVGFHLKHLGGSVDRLSTYLLGDQLSPQQLSHLRREAEGEETAATLLESVHSHLANSEMRLRTVHADQLFEPRTVGRQRLPTSVYGLLVHLAEHTQRHLGQIVTLAHQVKSG